MPRSRRRVLPTPGLTVTVAYLAARSPGVIRYVEPGGHALEVETDEGERLRFRLNRATALFLAEDGSGARLLFTAD